MDSFSKYKDCTYLICRTTFKTDVYGYDDGLTYTFEKGVKYKCIVGNSGNYIIFKPMDVLFNTLDNNTVNQITENFFTINEYRKFKIENL